MGCSQRGNLSTKGENFKILLVRDVGIPVVALSPGFETSDLSLKCCNLAVLRLQLFVIMGGGRSRELQRAIEAIFSAQS